jgi:hypothetical protein
VWDVLADDLVVGAGEVFDQGPLPVQGGRVAVGQPVGAGDVHGEQVGAVLRGGDAGGPADHGVTFGAAGQRDTTRSRVSQVPAMWWSAR